MARVLLQHISRSVMPDLSACTKAHHFLPASSQPTFFRHPQRLKVQTPMHVFRRHCVPELLIYIQLICSLIMRTNLRTTRRKRNRVRRTATKIFSRMRWRNLPSLMSPPPRLWFSLHDGFEKRGRYPAATVIVFQRYAFPLHLQIGNSRFLFIPLLYENVLLNNSLPRHLHCNRKHLCTSWIPEERFLSFHIQVKSQRLQLTAICKTIENSMLRSSMMASLFLGPDSTAQPRLEMKRGKRYKFGVACSKNKF